MNYSYLVKKVYPFRHCCIGNFYHISLLVKKRKIYSIGFSNSHKTHTYGTKFSYRFPTQHSEISAIVNFPLPNFRLKEMTMINIRFLRNGTPNIAKPCSACQELLRHFGIREVFFTNYLGEIEQCVL